MDYNSAIEVFNNLDEGDKEKEVYAYFGLAIFYTQLLEQQAMNMICIRRMVNGEFKTPTEIEALWNKYDFGNRTLGNLVNEIKHLYEISEDVSIELGRILKLRNYIAHDYFRFNSELFHSDLGMKRMIKDFINFRDDVRKIDKRLFEYFDKYRLDFKITDDLIQKLMEEIKQDTLKTDFDNYETIKKV